MAQRPEVKDSFQRALREVALEMELFLENHGQYIKKNCDKINLATKVKVVHFTILPKNCILKNMSEKTFRHIFFAETIVRFF